MPLKYPTYTFKDYEKDILSQGLPKVWQGICEYILSDAYDFNTNVLLGFANIGLLYEQGLAINDKNQKKSNGAYYTPKDTADLLADSLLDIDAGNVCDVACGTGNLILAYLEKIGYAAARELVNEGKVYLYEKDPTALNIAKTLVKKRYGEYPIAYCCDFLDSHTQPLPQNCKVISNPPYAMIKKSEVPNNWSVSEVLDDSCELYAAFMQKIIAGSVGSVIITPFSFINGNKFYSLRKFMNDYYGKIISFDNIPGHIFKGVKLGIFNSNKNNSVRAAITVAHKRKNDSDPNGFRCSQLIRFNDDERDKLLKKSVLESFISKDYQVVSDLNKKYSKCDDELQDFLSYWKYCSNKTLADCIEEGGEYKIQVPTTCRYHTVAISNPLNRKGFVELCFDDSFFRDFVYCLFNSSFAYAWWRIYDGGITYPKGLMMELPIFTVADIDKGSISECALMLRGLEKDYKVVKQNVGVQENLKFPHSVIEKVNEVLITAMDKDLTVPNFNRLHSNRALSINIPK